MLNSKDSVGKLTKAYIQNYQVKGCKSVRFYQNNGSSLNDNTSFLAQGIKNNDTLIAMENGAPFQKGSQRMIESHMC